ncbi:MAG: 3'(2'),5'-bisphosphate nucleotidase CysQ [Xanthomonadales bacterium]|nr:3'(2'),5'-bisphosphate nucleotidase CysQ [Xanthomonadales bacterium]ODU93706.1 MAG: 3'(2'),5'-bisphosphate nucleotidase [Rhodanobacter sp. SCN 66-43]OJY83329.1 MAG: 3'(2'),5'-bisphosphate nucleotidase [Xanthomonadales bacterium 66-474]
MSTLERFATECRQLARCAGAAILEIYAGSFAVEHKSDDSPLTAADMASHRVIVEGLRALAPDIPVLSEESKSIAWETRRAWPRYWLVDPLDGTREFVKRNGEFTVNIALIENHAPLLGVVLLPVTGDLYYGVAGEGAFLESAPGALPRPIATRAAAAVPVVAGSRSHGSDRQGEVLARLGDHRLVSVGSSIKFCMVARGDADLYLRLGPTSEWDTAAAQCVVEQAGGAVVNLHGEPLRYNTGDSLLNPEFLAIGDTSVDWLARLRPA